MRAKQYLAVLAVAGAIVLAPAAAAAELARTKQALVVLRVLAYDRMLDARAPRQVRIAVVHGSGAESLACASRMREVFDGMIGRVTVAGKAIAVDTVAASAANEHSFRRRRISVAYVCRGADSELPGLIRATRAAGVLTFSDQRDYVDRGLSIALVDGTSRIRIVINLEAARAEGAKLDSQLLRISEVSRR